MVREIENGIQGSFKEKWKRVKLSALQYCQAGDNYLISQLREEENLLPSIDEFAAVWQNWLQEFDQGESSTEAKAAMAVSRQGRDKVIALRIADELKRWLDD